MKSKEKKRRKKRRCICDKRERIDTCVMASFSSLKSAQDQNITLENEENNTHAHVR